MTISRRYGDYLRHFGATVPVREFAAHSTGASVALRHDVDHDIDIALEMARYEYDRGVRATYYVLHTAGYWQDPLLAEKLLQLQDYGHEVGIHLNILADWMRGNTDDPGQHLLKLLEPLRNTGVRIEGMSAHGDQLCYSGNFINYWAFRELRPDAPEYDEHNRTAEGPLSGENDKRVPYPVNHKIYRPSGASFDLWSVSMKEMGIAYDAWHLPMDHYFSDSGGSWKRTPDPLKFDLSRGRTQILIHPIHWVGTPQTYFFLSPARSGSKWFAQFLDTATPLEARHEYMLNHEFHDGTAAFKRTAGDFAALYDDKDEATRLIAEAWSRREEIKKDYAEVNVYLEAFLDTLKNFFPDATYVMLLRDPRAVIRSLLSRAWYDSPGDRAHRRVDVPEWDGCGQFARVCHYVEDVYEKLDSGCQSYIRFEDVTVDLRKLVDVLEGLGIPVHPRLAHHVHGKIVNATSGHQFPSFAHWTAKQQADYEQICGGTARRLGYGGSGGFGRQWAGKLYALRREAVRWLLRFRASRSRVILSSSAVPDSNSWEISGFLLERMENGVPLLKPDPSKEGSHRHCVLGGSKWAPANGTRQKSNGWPNERHTYLDGHIKAVVAEGGHISVFVLSFDNEGNMVHKRQVGVLSAKNGRVDFACRLRADVCWFDVGLYAPKDAVPACIELKKVKVELKSLAQGYSALD